MSEELKQQLAEAEKSRCDWRQSAGEWEQKYFEAKKQLAEARVRAEALEAFAKTVSCGAPSDRTYGAPKKEQWIESMQRKAKRCLKGSLGADEQKRKLRACPKCDGKGEMFTADLDWCPKCKHQWPGS